MESVCEADLFVVGPTLSRLRPPNRITISRTTETRKLSGLLSVLCDQGHSENETMNRLIIYSINKI